VVGQAVTAGDQSLFAAGSAEVPGMDEVWFKKGNILDGCVNIERGKKM